jgi:alkanesulfonate monooxygenase SsuD/methylene tetrahydromethanopterin reductase-like flavin-dependent oxidoreductase (luciferase family)
VKFSILLEVQILEPSPERERRAFHDCIAQVELADRLGYHAVWATEHHGLYEFSHSSAPESLLAYAAGRTSKIRLGHGVTLTPQRYNHPIRVAERVATLDILSDGRVNWGSGKGATSIERGAFQVDPSTLQDEWLEALEMIPRMWRSDVFEWHGRFYDIPPTTIVPKPVQRPHPPITIGGRGKQRTLRTAARWAQQWNAIVASPDDWLELKEVLAGHCAAIGRDVNEITCSVNVRVDPDAGLESVIAATAAYRDAGVDLIIVNLPHHAKPDSLQPLAEALTPLA